MSWPHIAAPALAERCPELLVELQAPASWTLAAELDPDEVALVIAWALDAPDVPAARLRLEHRAWRRGPTDRAKVPRYRPLWLLDPFCWPERLAAAGRWDDEGRPVAWDALRASPESPEVHAALTRRAEDLIAQLAPRDPFGPRKVTRAQELAEGRVLLELQLLLDAGVIDAQGLAQPYSAGRPTRPTRRGRGWGSAGDSAALPGGDHGR